MKITKIGHCCLVIEEAGLTILTDPGAWTDAQNQLTGIDAVLITHEHPDHFHVESLQAVLKNNPDVVVITNHAVGSLMAKANLSFQLLEHGQQKEIDGVRLEGYGSEHAAIYPSIPNVMNTGYMIADRFFYPGDAFYKPAKPVEILALPVCGPWMKISEAIDYAKAVKPKVAFSVHDGMLKILGPFHLLPQKILSESGIQFDVIEPGSSKDF
jgi:L-ascorbate metabolism protein UlaG (beta-lactamase superfamily)